MYRKRRRPREHKRRSYRRRNGTVVHSTIVNKGLKGRKKFKHIRLTKRRIFSRPDYSMSTRKLTPVRSFATELSRTAFEGSLATGLSMYTGNPLPLVAYNAYRALKLTEKISRKLSKEGVDKEIELLTKDAAKAGINQISESRIDAASKKLTNSFQAIGLTSLISNKTSLPEGTVNTAFENTVRNFFEEGVEEFSDFVVEAI